MRLRWCLLLSLLLPAVALATSMGPVPLDRLVRTSDDIVRARVLHQRTSEEAGALFTHTWLRVEQVLKGGHAAGEELVLRQAGGVSGERREGIVGDAQFEGNEEVVLVLKHEKRFHFLTNLALSKFRVERTAQGEVLVRDVGGLSFVPLAGAHTPAEQD
ncbi:MAG: hypothetical protein ACK4N5_25920, partial [Myxococcales bacterium]